MTEAGVNVFDPVGQGPYLGLSDRGFFRVFSVVFDQNVNGHTTVSQAGVFLPLFGPGMSVTIPQTRYVRPGYGHWRPSLKYLFKKNPVWQTMVWPLTLKKPSLWDRGMASDVRIQTTIEKMTQVWQTVMWPLTLQKPSLSDEVWPTELLNSVWPLAG